MFDSVSVRPTAGGMGVGAAVSLSGKSLGYATELRTTDGSAQERVALGTIVTVTGEEALSIVNSAENPVEYENASLTVVKLA